GHCWSFSSFPLSSSTVTIVGCTISPQAPSSSAADRQLLGFGPCRVGTDRRTCCDPSALSHTLGTSGRPHQHLSPLAPPPAPRAPAAIPAHFPTPSASVCAGTNIGRGARPHHHQRHTHPLHRGVLPLTVRDGACRQSPAARDRRKGADSDGVDALSGTGRSQRRRWISVRAWPCGSAEPCSGRCPSGSEAAYSGFPVPRDGCAQ